MGTERKNPWVEPILYQGKALAPAPPASAETGYRAARFLALARVDRDASRKPTEEELWNFARAGMEALRVLEERAGAMRLATAVDLCPVVTSHAESLAQGKPCGPRCDCDYRPDGTPKTGEDRRRESREWMAELAAGVEADARARQP